MASARVLVVDDEPMVVNVVSQLLSLQGYEVLRAAGPKQALEIICSNKPSVDLVLSDITMPEMLGTDLVREIARISPQTSSVLMTGGIVAAADMPDGVPVLRKPLSFPDLVSTIEGALARAAEARADLLRECQRSAGLQRQSKQLHSELHQVLREALKIMRKSKETKGD